MSDKLPRWDCRNNADRRLLEEWTNAQLEAEAKAFYEDFDLEYEMWISEQTAAWAEQDINSRYRRGRVAVAVENNDIKTLDRLMADPELRPLALRLLTHKPGRGRKRGERRPNDIPELTRNALEYASQDVDRIKQIWKNHFNKQNRLERPTAIAIAARRCNVDENLLINWRKNH